MKGPSFRPTPRGSPAPYRIAEDTLMSVRRGDWMQTFTGRQFWPMDPLASEIDILDIAHALSMQCRFAGHCNRFYSVAEHSFLLSRCVPQELALAALLHDASEAYLVDVPRPVKPFLTGYHLAEFRVMEAVRERFGLTVEALDAIKEADARILGDEREQNMNVPPAEWADTGPLLGITLRFWQPAKAKAMFLDEFIRLSRLAVETGATRAAEGGAA